MDNEIETVDDLVKALKPYLKKKLRLVIASCPLKLREHNGQTLALSKCRPVGDIQQGFYHEERPIFNFSVLEDTEHIDAVDSICLFHLDTNDQEMSKEYIECGLKKLSLETGVSSKTTKLNSPKALTPSVEVTAPVKRTCSIRLSTRSRGTFPGSME